MKIGLVRHFKVNIDRAGRRMSPGQFDEWFDAYNAADIFPGETDLSGMHWDRCYASDLNRAIKTAQTIYHGEITVDPNLREIRPYAAFKRNFRLPVMWWLILARASLILRGRSQLESMRDFKTRLNGMIDKAEKACGDTLMVAHGAVLLFMQRELRRRGYKGPHYLQPKHGMLYLFEKPD